MFFRVSPEGVKPMDGLNNPNLYAIIPPPGKKCGLKGVVAFAAKVHYHNDR